MSAPLAEKVGEVAGELSQMRRELGQMSDRLDAHILSCRLLLLMVTVAFTALVAWIKL